MHPRGKDALKWTATLALVVAAGLACAFSLVGCEPKPRVPLTAEGVPHVRVRLLSGVTECTLSATHPARLLVGDDIEGTWLSAGHPVRLTFDRQWEVDGRPLPNLRHEQGGVVNSNVYSLALRIIPAADGDVQVDGQAYRGTYLFTTAASAAFDVINDVDVESYLRGVLPKELLPDWRDETYKAQCVIARTYALYEARSGPSGRQWDLNPDERSQVYGGLSAETPKSVAAVAATRGQVAAYGPPGQEKIFKAYFSACCGGTCASAADVFGDAPIPPLAAKSNDGVCAISPRYVWPTVTLAKTELTRRLRVYGQRNGTALASLPGVRTLAIASVNPFGRPTAFLLTDTRGQQYRMAAEALRTAVNTDAPNTAPGTPPTTVYSAFFRPVDDGDSIRLTNGHGFGHGVGACQWCMQARAVAGQRYDAIVFSQYPQAVLLKAY